MRDFDGKFVEADGETGLMRARSSGRENKRRDGGRGKGLRIHDEGERGGGWGEAESGWWGFLYRRLDIRHRRWGENESGGEQRRRFCGGGG